jgi:hypothetical protein
MAGGFHTQDLWSLALVVARLRLVLKLIQAIRNALPRPREVNESQTTCADGTREDFRRRLAPSWISRSSGMELGEPRSNLKQFIAMRIPRGVLMVEWCPLETRL